MKEEMSILKQNQERLMKNVVTITNVGEWKQVFTPMTMDQPNGLTQWQILKNQQLYSVYFLSSLLIFCLLLSN